MKIIQNILQKTKASKLWFSMVVVLIAILNVSSVEAGSLQKGEVYSMPNGKGTIEVISGSELEITGNGNTLVAEYAFKGDKLRIVYTVMGAKVVQYYLLTNEGLKEERTGAVYFSKAGLAAQRVALQEEMRKAQAEANRKQMMTDNRDGTITHAITKFMWQKDDDGQERNWDDSINYCRGLSLAGHSDWRLPETDELNTIWKIASSNEAIRKTYFPSMKSSLYWSSTVVGFNPAFARTVPEPNPYGEDGRKTRTHYVRCVRFG